MTKSELRMLSAEFGLAEPLIKSVAEVEGAGRGFDPVTKKILIQFEPSWFKRKWLQWTKSVGIWAENKVDNQVKEWIAFNDAFKRNANSAMESTSWGMMQVMGFHYKLLGFKTVGDLVDYCKVSEYNQCRIALLFIKSNKKMFDALKRADFSTFAYYYNGSSYKKFKYDTRLLQAYIRHSNL